VREERSLPAGSAVVWLNQRASKVIAGLLEPDCPDSLVSWGYFDSIFEEKEYAEAYILETLAEDMIAKNPSLKKEFEGRLARDPELRKSPEARLRFFYERSPYFDARKNAYPIVRITSRKQV
jgi:hypothetical protein